MKNFISVAVISLLSIYTALAQSTEVSGTVSDTSGEPVPGAAVMITGSTIGTMTDIDGKFVLGLKNEPSDNATLTVSSIGFKNAVVPMAGQSVFNIVLENDQNIIEETVVIGYSTIKKKDLTGSIASVDGNKIQSRQTTSVSGALQGAMPGVTVTRSSSTPGVIADVIVGALGQNPNPIVLLIVIFVVGCVLTNFMSNTATTALMVPIATSLASNLGADPRSMIIATVIACSCAYATPIGMPANTMVVGLGGYKFRDYVKSGLPLIAVSFVLCIILLPILFPFYG